MSGTRLDEVESRYLLLRAKWKKFGEPSVGEKEKMFDDLEWLISEARVLLGLLSDGAEDGSVFLRATREMGREDVLGLLSTSLAESIRTKMVGVGDVGQTVSEVVTGYRRAVGALENIRELCTMSKGSYGVVGSIERLCSHGLGEVIEE